VSFSFKGGLSQLKNQLKKMRWSAAIKDFISKNNNQFRKLKSERNEKSRLNSKFNQTKTLKAFLGFEISYLINFIAQT
jgi:hypothetical protein